MSLEINEDRSYPILSDQRLTEMIKQELKIEDLQAMFAGNVGALETTEQRELDLAVKFAGSLIAKYPTELGSYSVEDLLIKIKSIAQAEADHVIAANGLQALISVLRFTGHTVTITTNPDGTISGVVSPLPAFGFDRAISNYNATYLAAHFFDFVSDTEQTLVKAFEDVVLP